MKKNRIARASQIAWVCMALHGCSTNTAPQPAQSGTVVQVDPAFKDAGAGSTPAAPSSMTTTGNADTPPAMMGNASGGSPAITGSGGQPDTHADAGMPRMGSGGEGGRGTVDAGLGEPDGTPDAAVDGGRRDSGAGSGGVGSGSGGDDGDDGE